MKYTIDLDARQITGLDAERIAYNANNPQNILADVPAYLDWLISGAAETAALKIDTVSQKKAEYIASLPSEKQAAVAAAIDLEVAK